MSFHLSVRWWAGSLLSATSGGWEWPSSVSPGSSTPCSTSTTWARGVACFIAGATGCCWCCTGPSTYLCLVSPTSHQRRITVGLPACYPYPHVCSQLIISDTILVFSFTQELLHRVHSLLHLAHAPLSSPLQTGQMPSHLQGE